MRSARYFTAVAALLLAVAPSPARAQVRTVLPIAYVSVQRILTEADDAKAGAKELETLRTSRAQDLTAKRQALDATRLQIANAGGYFSSSRRAQLQETARRQEAELQQASQQAQADFTELQRQVQERIKEELGRTLTAIASQRGFAYVLNRDAAVLLAPTGADLTDEVLKRLNTLAAERSAAAEGNAAKPGPAPAPAPAKQP